MKSLHKFFNRQDLPWVRLFWNNHYRDKGVPIDHKKGLFQWRDILKTLSYFKHIVKVFVGDDRSVFLQHDRWIDRLLSLAYPELFSYARNRYLTLFSAKVVTLLQGLFQLPLSATVLGQLQALEICMQNIHMREEVDRWDGVQGSGRYSTQKVYKIIHSSLLVPRTFIHLWRSKCQPKQKLFFQLVLQDMLNTKAMLKRRGTELDSYTYENCIMQKEETWSHLLLKCGFVRRCWQIISVAPLRNSNPHLVVQDFRIKSEKPWSMRMLVIMAWCIQKCRNGWIFEGTPPTTQLCKDLFKKEFLLITYRMRDWIVEDIRTR